jgi:hypothetical protein
MCAIMTILQSLRPVRCSLALLPMLALAACGGVPADDLKSSEFRVVRTAQKPIWTYSQCLADRFAALRASDAGSRKLDLKVNVTRAGIELMSPQGRRDDASPQYWYLVQVQPIDDGVRTSAWVSRWLNGPSPQEMLLRLDDAIQICGSESV